MQYKRLTLLCGHYGSGKTNVAVNMALDLKKQREKVTLADLDIVNPYFRAKDSSDILKKNGIELICSPFANSNVDFPALPQELYAITDDRSRSAVLDIGGDERGALALGRIAPAINEENDYEMYMVVNFYRPLTRDAKSVKEVLDEIEFACKIKFTGIINNSNLGPETTPETVLKSLDFAKSVSEISGLDTVLTTVESSLYNKLEGKIPDLFPINLKQIP
ncbi:MAG: hypothetical protein KBS52_07475 [Clostridiales bacterium]|nr:hypothetical protein [Candidatus Equinaster intestinalis]